MVVGYKKVGKHASGVPKLNPAQERARRSVSEFRKLLPTLTAYARNLTGRKDVKVEMDAHSNGHTDGKIIYFRPPVALGDVELMRHDKPVCEKRDPETFRQLCPACGVREDILATVYHEISHIAFDTFLKVGSDDVNTALEMIEKTAPEWYYKQVRERYNANKWAGIDSFLKLAAVVNPYFKALVNGLEDVRIDERMAVARPGTRIMQAAKIFRVAIEGVEQKDASGRTIHVAWPDYEVNLQAAIALFCYASGYPVKGWFASQVEEALFDEQITALCRDVRGLQSARKVFDRSFEIFLRMRELGFFVTRDEELPEPPSASPAPPAEPEPPQPEPDSDVGESDDSCEPDGSDSGSDGSSDAEGSDSERDEGASSDSGGESEGESDPSSGSIPEAEPNDAAGDPDSDSEGDGNGQDSAAGSESDDSSDSSTDDGSESSDDGDGAESGGDRGEPSADSEGSSDGEEQAASGSEAGSEDGGLEEEGTEAGGDVQSDNPPDADGDGAGDDPGSGTSDESTAEADSASTRAGGGSGSGDGGRDGTGEEQLAREAEDFEGSSGDLERGDSDSSDAETSIDSDSDSSTDSSDESGRDSEADGTDPNGDAAGSELDTETSSGEPDAAESERSESDADVSRSSGDGESDSESSEDLGPDYGTDPTDDSFVEPIDYRPEEKIDGTEGEEKSIVPPTIDSDHPIELVDMGLHSELEEPAPSVEQEIENAIVQGVYFTQPSSHIGGLAVWKYSEAADDAVQRPWHAWGGTYYDGFYGTQSHADIDPIGERHLGPALMKLRLAFEDNKRSHRNRNQRAGRIDGRTLGKRAWQTDDDRLFGRKILPKKKDYFVVIGLDISGSTRGVNLKMIKEAALAQAELCQRIGVKFCVYAHTGGPLDLDRLDARYVDIYEIKGPEQPWDNKTREALMEIGPSAANLDGHTLEFYRKVAERDQATNKVILYYSDGAMPAENYNEELEILQSEIQTCRKLKITLLGVGVRTDAPKDHGLDTVQIDDSSEVGKVVAHLERALIP